MKNFIAESFNSWKSYDSAGNLQVFVNSKGDLGLSGDRLATPEEYNSAPIVVSRYLKGNEGVGLSDGSYTQKGKRKSIY